MKLRNKKTGEIGKLVLNLNPNRESYSVLSTENGNTVCGNLVLADYDTLAKLNEEWEDYEELKEKYHWFISGRGTIEIEKDADDYWNRGHKSIGNYFETKEEAEKAVGKLKAVKRLKDAGFRFGGWETDSDGDLRSVLCNRKDRVQFNNAETLAMAKDLDLLFGGEE